MHEYTHQILNDPQNPNHHLNWGRKKDLGKKFRQGSGSHSFTSEKKRSQFCLSFCKVSTCRTVLFLIKNYLLNWVRKKVLGKSSDVTGCITMVRGSYIWRGSWCVFEFFTQHQRGRLCITEKARYTGCPKKKDTVTLSHNFRLNYLNS